MENRDRILDHALRTHFGAELDPEQEKQQAARIVEAWRRGESGSLTQAELEEIRRIAEGPRLVRNGGNQTAASHDEKRAPTWVIAVAAVLVVAIGLLLWSELSPAGEAVDPDQRGGPVAQNSESPTEAQTPKPAPFAVAKAEVLLLRGPARTELRAERLERGDALLSLGDSVAVLFADGTEFYLHTPGLATIDHVDEVPVVELSLGDLSLQSSALGARIEAGFATIEVGPDTGLTAEIVRSQRSEREGRLPPLDVALARTILVTGLEEVRSLRVRVTQGEAVVVSGDLRHELDVSSGNFVVPSRRAPVVPAEDFARFESLMDSLASLAKRIPGFAIAPTSMLELGRSMRELLARHPDLREVFRQNVRAIRADREASSVFTSFALDLIAIGEDRAGLELASEIWMTDAELFGVGQLMAYAEQSGFEFERELKERVRMQLDDPDLFEEPVLYPAAYLAFHGDDIGREALEEFSEYAASRADEFALLREPMGLLGADYLVASFALERLGETGRRGSAIERVATAAEELLDLDQREGAQRLILMLEMLTAQVDPQQETPLLSAVLIWPAFLDPSAYEKTDETVPFDAEAWRARLSAVRDR